MPITKPEANATSAGQSDGGRSSESSGSEDDMDDLDLPRMLPAIGGWAGSRLSGDGERPDTSAETR